MAELTEAERRYNLNQALASTRIEGHGPTAEFLADCEAMIKGEITREEAMARSRARAMEKISNMPSATDDC